MLYANCVECVVEWLSFLYKQQWERMLLAYQGVDSGPEEGVTEQEFDKLAFRCGRILDSDMQVCVIHVDYYYYYFTFYFIFH